MAGYLVQLRRALFRLADAPSASDKVGIETLDDVSVVTSERVNVFEQDKLTLAQNGAPVTNRSEQLWTTLKIWTEAWVRDVLSDQTARFFLVTNRSLEGTAVKALERGDRDAEANARIVAELESESRQDPHGKLQALINEVVSRGHDTLMGVVANARIETGASVFNQAVVDQTIARLHLSDVIDGQQVYDMLLGWLTNVCLLRWQRGESAWVSRSEFDRQLQATLQSVHRRRVAARASRVIPVSIDDKKEAKTHHFLHHLALIEMPDERIDEELLHYIWYNKEKFRLIAGGHIPDDEWGARADRLKQKWRLFREKRRMFGQGNSHVAVGYQIYFDCAEIREPLGNEPMPEPYMTIGHLHRLADDDAVYWHPEYVPGPKVT